VDVKSKPIEIKAAFSHFFGVGCKGRNYINAALLSFTKPVKCLDYILHPLRDAKVCRRDFSVTGRN